MLSLPTLEENIPLGEALKVITSNAAEILKLKSKGSIEKGKDADLVIFNGIPALDTNANVQYTIINGKIVYKKN